MDSKTCRELGETVLAALKDVEAKFNVKARYVGGNYGTSNCQLKFEFADVADDGTVKTRAAEAWKYAVMDGLPADGLGKVFEFRGTQYKVTGYKPSCKYNIMAERVHDGRGFKFEALAVFRDCEAARQMAFARR